jgi:hypothetical protein
LASFGYPLGILAEDVKTVGFRGVSADVALAATSDQLVVICQFSENIWQLAGIFSAMGRIYNPAWVNPVIASEIDALTKSASVTSTSFSRSVVAPIWSPAPRFWPT